MRANKNIFFITVTLILNVSIGLGQFTAEIEAANIGETGAGFVINGINQYDNSGFSVSTAGDMNGDGFEDVIIGAPEDDTNGFWSGSSYVVFGQASGLPTALELSELNGFLGFKINGIEGGGRSGDSVSNAGDVNGDGFDDVIIGAPRDDTNGSLAGASYIVFGRANNYPVALELSELNGTNGIVINGIVVRGELGSSVSTAGDVNGDGFDDVIIGAPGDDTNGYKSGASYVVFGQAYHFPATFELSELNGSNGFVLKGVRTWDLLGSSVSTAGDVNGDGIDDVIIGVPRNHPYDNRSGVFYIVFGKTNGFPAVVELADLNGKNGFMLNGVAADVGSQNSVSTAGDVNGDGFDDIIIGDLGQSYVVFGHANDFSVVVELSELDGNNGFLLSGRETNRHSHFPANSAGDINGDGFDDVLVGSPYDNSNGINSGVGYLVFGKASPFQRSIELPMLNGSDGFVLNGINHGDNLGFAVSAAGDFNGDGFGDVIIGAKDAEPNGKESGASYLLYGSFKCQPDEYIYHVSTTIQLNYAIECASRSLSTNTIKLITDITLRTTFDDNTVNSSYSSSPPKIGKTGTKSINSTIILDGNGYSLKRDDLSCELNGLSDEKEFRLLNLMGIGAKLALKNIELHNGCADGSTESASQGGAIYIDPDAVIESINATTFSNNSASSGGAIYSEGLINEIINSTFSSNQATGFSTDSAQGAAIRTQTAFNVFNNTFYNNEAIGANSEGGALYASADVMGLENNLFFSNLADDGSDCAHSSGVTVVGVNNLTTKSFNLCPSAGIAESFTPLEIYSLNNNGCYQPLANGSCAQTHAIGVNSAAKDAGNLNSTEFDQRGFGIIGTRDVGAFEFNGINFDVIFKDSFQ